MIGNLLVSQAHKWTDGRGIRCCKGIPLSLYLSLFSTRVMCRLVLSCVVSFRVMLSCLSSRVACCPVWCRVVRATNKKSKNNDKRLYRTKGKVSASGNSNMEDRSNKNGSNKIYTDHEQPHRPPHPPSPPPLQPQEQLQQQQPHEVVECSRRRKRRRQQ